MQRSSLLSAGILIPLASLGAFPVPVAAQDVREASTGQTLFESRCVACHSLDASRVGPMLRGVVGRKVASVAGYEYSDALKRVKGRWDERRLRMWLQDPQSIAPGAKMAFSLASAADRDAVIRYLASTTSPSRAARGESGTKSSRSPGHIQVRFSFERHAGSAAVHAPEPVNSN